MSDFEENASYNGFDTTDHQAAYIYTPAGADDLTSRPAKRRKVKGSRSLIQPPEDASTIAFAPRFDGVENPACAALRHELYEEAWSATEQKIQIILDEANEDTLSEVTTFVNGAKDIEGLDRIPAGFIVTGPNIASQGLLFHQLSARLQSDVDGPVVTLRSGDASNLKAVLKQLIRDATNQKPSIDEDEDEHSYEYSGRKLLNYDLQIFHTFVKTRKSEAVVIAFQDSEAFDSTLLADLILLFNSWRNRIPFILLFGIATSVELFNERLSRAASRCLHGAQFDVEQTSSLLERIFLKAVAGVDTPLRLSSSVVSSLIERQYDHVQSVQSFITALKYIYMCHFYENALSVLTYDTSRTISDILQPEHLQAIRTLPSYRSFIENLVELGDLNKAKSLLEDDNTLLIEEIGASISSRKIVNLRFLRAIHLVSCASPQPISPMELYMTTFEGQLSESTTLQNVLDATKRMTPEDVTKFIQSLFDAIQDGCPEMDLEGWQDDDSDFIASLYQILTNNNKIFKDASESGIPVRSSYAIQSKGLRTTVIAQRVQLSYENSALTEQDKSFTSLVDQLSTILTDYFNLSNPQHIFLSETWLYDNTQRHRAVFQPRPRAAIERALSAPYDYINCACCDPVDGLAPTHPATAILYQMYLETSAIINIHDLWSAFYEMISGGDDHQTNERDALVLFYRALADLKSLGMVKQSKKKTDHLAKVAWHGL